MNNDALKSEIIYGDLDGTIRSGRFIEVRTWDDSNHITIDLANNGTHTVWNFELKDRTYIDNIKNCIKDICDKFYEDDGSGVVIDLIMYEIDNLFGDMYDEWFDDEKYYEQEMRSEEEICEYMDEAFDRVWLVRKQNLYWNLLTGQETIQLDIMDGMIKAVDRACEKWGIDFKEPVSDWDYGYWSGILSALRWVMGDEKDFLDT